MENSITIFRDNYQSQKDYLKDFQDFCKYYGYKVKVFGGWKFFTFQQDYKIWKNQK